MNEIEMLFVEALDMDHYGLRTVKVHGGEWDGVEVAIADTEDEATKAAKLAAESSLWAFRPEFIGSFLGLDAKKIEALGKLQAELCEGAHEIVEMFLGDRLDEFLASAVDVDGRGHFLSSYDGEEDDGENVSPALAGKLVYRLN